MEKISASLAFISGVNGGADLTSSFMACSMAISVLDFFGAAFDFGGSGRFGELASGWFGSLAASSDELHDGMAISLVWAIRESG